MKVGVYYRGKSLIGSCVYEIVEAGNRDPQLSTIWRIAEALNITWGGSWKNNAMVARLLNPAEAEDAVAEMFSRIAGTHREPGLSKSQKALVFGAVLAVATSAAVICIVMRKKAEKSHRFGGNAPVE